MPKEVACTCGGSNENCKFCFGAGFTTVPSIEGEFVPRPSAFRVEDETFGSPAISVVKATPEERARWVPCTKLSLGEPSGEVSEMGQNNRSVPEVAKCLKKCGLCGNEIDANLYQRHLDECPKRLGARQGIAYLLVESRRDKKRKSRTKSLSPRQKIEGEGEIGGVAIHDSKFHERTDRMDANRNMGFIAREFGRYGSHPLHDGFDGESGPEKKF